MTSKETDDSIYFWISKMMAASIHETDPELYALIQKEKNRQNYGLEMIASENFASYSVLECLSTCLHNKYSEGMPGQRYYAGNKFIDQIETLAQRRALEAYDLNPNEWGVNVQPYSGSPANLAVYTALLQPHDRIMGLDLPDGGHLTHGFMTSTRRVSATSVFFESMPYKVDPKTGLIDYDRLEANAKLFRPKLIIAGVSCYSRCLDYARFRKICDSVNAYLLADMSHIAGLVAAKQIPSPFRYADVVTTTTHKTLRGPRAAVIFYRKGVRRVELCGKKTMYDLETRINNAVFPGLQGGPHNNTIAAIATAFKQAKTTEFAEYQAQTIINAKYLCKKLINYGYNVVTGGTDTHMMSIDLKNIGVTGAQAEYILEKVYIFCNKNTVPGDVSALNPSGIRLGTSALTSRGLVESDIGIVAGKIHDAITIAVEAIKIVKESKNGENFYDIVDNNSDISHRCDRLREDVQNFGQTHPLPGFGYL